MSKLKKPLDRFGRLFHRLQDVDYQIFYLPGVHNFLPDFLYRCLFPDDDLDVVQTQYDCNFIEIKSVINWEIEQRKNSVLA